MDEESLKKSDNNGNYEGVDVVHVAPEEAGEGVEEKAAKLEKNAMVPEEALDKSIHSAEELESPLPEDIFSLLYISKPFEWTCIYCIIVFVVQATVILLIMADLLAGGSEHNPLSLPPGVSLEVTIAQAVSMVLAVSTQTNLLTAFSRINLGQRYDHSHVRSVHPYATKWDYWVSTTMQLFVGTAMLVDSFILNMQSSSVLSLMLNFAALAFVSEIQQTAFWIAKNGYISHAVEEDARLVSNFQIPRYKTTNPYVKRGLFGICVGALLFFYGLLARQQRDGRFICNQLMAQFGDEIRPDLAFHSGIYIQEEGRLIGGRAVYKSSKFDAQGRAAYFAYCDELAAWTFSGLLDVESSELVNNTFVSRRREDVEPCKYWAKSQETNTYDIIESYSRPWQVKDYLTNQTNTIDHFTLLCNDCQGNRASHDCSGNGACVENKCVCDKERIGVNCEHPMPCKTLALDQRTQPFPYAEGGKFLPKTNYSLLTYNDSTPVLVYNKPVYVARLGASKLPLNVIMFMGRRWGLFLNLEFFDAQQYEQYKENLHLYLPVDFHAWFSKHIVYFFTDPMDLGSPSDGSTPIDLQWYQSKVLIKVGNRALYRVDKNQPTGTVFLCPECQPVLNGCLNGGYCNMPRKVTNDVYELLTQTGTCICTEGYEGELCERQKDCFEANAQCYNGGNCTGTGACRCPFGYSGKLCQSEINQEFLDVYIEEGISSGLITEEQGMAILNSTMEGK